MSHRHQLVFAFCATLALGCSGKVGSYGPGGNTGAVCSDPLSVAPRRLLRVTLNQSANAIQALLGPAAATMVQTQFGLGDPTQNTFPALNGPREGVSIIPSLFSKIDMIASATGQYVATNYAAVTGCASATDANCGQQWLLSFAEKAYRRPLDSREQMSLVQVLTEIQAPAVGGSLQEAMQNGVYAVLNSPQFLYRTEFGDTSKASKDGVPLTPYEVASQLSFFLADGPPDQMLLDAARQNRLGSVDQVTIQVNRLLADPGVQQNLSFAMFTYFKLNLLDNVVIDPAKVPVFNTGLENAMYTEGELFLKQTLWGGGTLNDLLVSRTTFVNADLATNVYKIPVPAGATTSAFVATQLPETRVGILTLSPFITSRARTDVGSVVARGLVVDETILCQTIPGPPAELSAQIAAAKTNLANDTEKEKANYRDTTSPCNGCHTNFDPFGLVLENYDVIARYRTVDDQNRPIDATATLPASLGGGPVMDAVDMAHKLADNGGFTTCMTKSMLQYALSDVTSAPVDTGSCAVQTVMSKFQSGDQTFASLVREVAISKTVALRKGGN